MRSNICKIENGTKDLAAILRESEKVAEYNELTQKQALQLRLICEEIDGMLPNIVDDFNGDLWIELEDGVCKVNISIGFEEFSLEKKEELINIAKNKKNSSAVGVVGKIRNSIENFFLAEENIGAVSPATGHVHLGMGYSEGIDYAYLWSLEQYRNTVIKEDKRESWDELEKSVIASVADDIIVGVKGKCAQIIIVKKFA